MRLYRVLWCKVIGESFVKAKNIEDAKERIRRGEDIDYNEEVGGDIDIHEIVHIPTKG